MMMDQENGYGMRAGDHDMLLNGLQAHMADADCLLLNSDAYGMDAMNEDGDYLPPWLQSSYLPGE